MTPYYADDWLTVYHGDARAVMAEMEPESVHCVVTSPPYWGLRDYGTATWVGGDSAHDHSFRADAGATSQRVGRSYQQGHPHRDCSCGAVREDGQLGLEPTPEAYVENMVAVFREVRRVLRSDGTVWLNLGDSLDRKQLVGIPWRVAFALQADGWYLRSDIIWSKPNPMPESVTDRPTKSHEYLFLLSKSPRYYFDADAVREQVTPANAEHNGRYVEASKGYRVKLAATDARNDSGQGMYPTPAAGRNIRSVWTVATAPYPGAHFATFPPKLIEPCIKAGTSERGVCPECGAPWERIVERGASSWERRKANGDPSRYGLDAPVRKIHGPFDDAADRAAGGLGVPSARTMTGWRPSCSPTCDYPSAVAFHPANVGDRQKPVPATVLDPFAGSGTTGMVAQSLSRRAVLIDLSMDYLGQLMDRNRDIPLGLGA